MIKKDVDTRQLLDELIELCITGNNGDYYLDGYVDSGDLVEIIQKHLDPDFTNDVSPWHPPAPKRTPSEHELTVDKVMKNVYAEHIKKQLEQPSFLSKLFTNPPA